MNNEFISMGVLNARDISEKGKTTLLHDIEVGKYDYLVGSKLAKVVINGRTGRSLRPEGFVINKEDLIRFAKQNVDSFEYYADSKDLSTVDETVDSKDIIGVASMISSVVEATNIEKEDIEKINKETSKIYASIKQASRFNEDISKLCDTDNESVIKSVNISTLFMAFYDNLKKDKNMFEKTESDNVIKIAALHNLGKFFENKNNFALLKKELQSKTGYYSNITSEMKKSGFLVGIDINNNSENFVYDEKFMPFYTYLLLKRLNMPEITQPVITSILYQTENPGKTGIQKIEMPAFYTLKRDKKDSLLLASMFNFCKKYFEAVVDFQANNGTPQDIIDAILKEAKENTVDSTLVEQFFEYFDLTPTGTKVILSDNTIAEVYKPSISAANKPVIKVYETEKIKKNIFNSGTMVTSKLIDLDNIKENPEELSIKKIFDIRKISLNEKGDKIKEQNKNFNINRKQYMNNRYVKIMTSDLISSNAAKNSKLQFIDYFATLGKMNYNILSNELVRFLKTVPSIATSNYGGIIENVIDKISILTEHDYNEYKITVGNSSLATRTIENLQKIPDQFKKSNDFYEIKLKSIYMDSKNGNLTSVNKKFDNLGKLFNINRIDEYMKKIQMNNTNINIDELKNEIVEAYNVCSKIKEDSEKQTKI